STFLYTSPYTRDLHSSPTRRSSDLYGVPFAVKDNIDVLGFATTAACPEYAYEPQADAEVVRLLRAAGAIVLGKTNLDQFATGLRSEEHTSELQSRENLVCRLLLEKK